MAMDAKTESNKRRRKASPPHPPPIIPHLCDLPESIVLDIASYLPKLQRTLFTIATGAPSSFWVTHHLDGNPVPPNAIRSTLDVGKWKVLDFIDVEKRVANKLTDDDIYAVLVCIGAINSVEVLKLTGCINVTGCGLEPLRDSERLKQIDLSLVKQNQSPILKPEPLISEAATLPILHSIVDKGVHCLLRHLFLPKKWRNERSTSLNNFLHKYDSLIEDRNPVCLECNNRIGISLDMALYVCCDRVNSDWGVQYHTCYSCLHHFCDARSNDLDPCQGWLEICKVCEKGYCDGCMKVGVVENVR